MIGVVRGVFALARALGPDRSSAVGGAIARRLGPLLPQHRIGLANLRAAFPDKSEAEIRAILAGAWENIGRTRRRIPPSRPALRLRPLLRRDRAHRGRRHRALHRPRRGRQAGPDLLGPSRELGAAADLRRPLRPRRDRGLPPAERAGGRPCAARDQEPRPWAASRRRGRAPPSRCGRARARRPSRHADRPAFHPRRHGRLPRPAGIHQSDHGQVRARASTARSTACG